MIAINLKFAGLAFAAALATSAATLVATGAPAHAAQPVVVEAPVRSATVSHADLNLAEASGVRRLNARVRSAAERLCSEPGTKSVKVFAEGKACLKLAIETAQPQVRQAIARQARQQFAGASR